MTLLEIVNHLLRETGVGDAISTTAGLDPNSDAARVVMAVQNAQKDLSRKVPMSPLKKTGTIHTSARVQLANLTTWPQSANGLIVLDGESEISGQSDNALPVDEAWNGRLFHVLTTKEVYRVRDVSLVDSNFQLADFAGSTVTWKHGDKSLDSSGTALTRAGTYDSSATYPAGEIAQDRYLLPADFKLPDDLNQFWGPGQIRLVGSRDFDSERYQATANLWTVGRPRVATIRETYIADNALRYYVELFPIPDEAIQLPFRYEALATEMEADDDFSGYHGEYEMALLSRARWYIFRFIVKSLEDAQLEEATWRDIVGDAHKSPLTKLEAPQFEPETGRDHWGTAYGDYPRLRDYRNSPDG